jgi:hypothetical protein
VISSHTGDDAVAIEDELPARTTVQPPLSGDTYASGCPMITPTFQRSLTLLAN